MTALDLVELRPQEVVLSLFGEYVLEDRAIWSGGLACLLEEVGFSSAAARIALGRVVSRGLLERIKVGRRTYYEVTPRLRDVLAEGRRQTFWFRQPSEFDRTWTLVWYVIGNDERLLRRRLGRNLSFLGFGSLQDGTRIAPGDRRQEVAKVLQRLELESLVLVFVGSASETRMHETILERAWNLEALGERYAAFADSAKPLRKAGALGRLDDREAFIVRTRALEAARQFAPQDPKLPDSVLRRGWRRREAIETFDLVETALREPAARHFAITVGDGVETNRAAR